MWSYYGYQWGLPFLIASLILFLFIKRWKKRKHSGWWLAFLFFSLTLVLTIPVKANPFEQQLAAYQKSEGILQQLSDLTNHSFFKSVTLAENVTEKEIDSLSKQLVFVSENKQETAKEYLDQAREALKVQQAMLFFEDYLDFDPEYYFSSPIMSNINFDYLDEAQELVNQLPDRREKRILSNYLTDIKNQLQE